MTAGDDETRAERAAQAHLEARHPAITGAYAIALPRQAVLLDLREVGLCTCLLADQPRRATANKRGVAEPTATPSPPEGGDRPAPADVDDHCRRGTVR